jgi:hypothetical protein
LVVSFARVYPRRWIVLRQVTPTRCNHQNDTANEAAKNPLHIARKGSPGLLLSWSPALLLSCGRCRLFFGYSLFVFLLLLWLLVLVLVLSLLFSFDFICLDLF